MTRPLDGRVAVVTGAYGRLGPVWCGALLDAGATVIALDLATASLSAPFRALQQTAGDRLRSATADVLDRASLVAVRERCEADGQVPSVLVNNAGIDQPPGPTVTYRLEEIPLEVFGRVLDVNLLGAFQAIQVFGVRHAACAARLHHQHRLALRVGLARRPFLRPHGGRSAFLKPPAYGASKAALVNLTRYLATHWGPPGVRVNALSPGGVEGGQDPEFKRKFNGRVPLGRMCRGRGLVGRCYFSRPMARPT